MFAVAIVAWILAGPFIASSLAATAGPSPIVVHVSAALGALATFAVLARRIANHDARRARTLVEAERRVITHLHDVERLRSTFLRGVSHELRTPLTNIIGYGLTLQDHLDELDGDMAGDVTGRLVANARKLEHLVLNLLELDTDEAPSAHARSVRLDDVVASALSRVETGAHHVRVKAERVTAEIDPDKVGRIIEELVRNAIRHTPDGTNVWVFVAARGRSIRITVEDDGRGVDPAVRRAVFEPFTQGADAESAPSPGLGIGLAVVRRCVELQHGQLHLRHSAFGGARFEVVLPRPTGVSRRPSTTHAAGRHVRTPVATDVR
ncbi:MAG: HAMP domain-containing sensor histidine kinase [Nitriliruptoraceae bacterium]